MTQNIFPTKNLVLLFVKNCKFSINVQIDIYVENTITPHTFFFQIKKEDIRTPSVIFLSLQLCEFCVLLIQIMIVDVIKWQHGILEFENKVI